MKEIGGYFEFEKLLDKEYYPDLISFDTARSCLLYLIRKKNIKKIYLPIFMCDCIEIILNREAIVYEFYEIDENFRPIFNKFPKKNEYFYLVNFYGQITQEEIKNYKKKLKRIIVDNTQAFFQEPITGIDAIYTCRKYFGVPDGAYLSTDIQTIDTFPKRTACNRIGHILGRLEGTANEYYDEYIENEVDFDNNEIHQTSILAKNILGAIPYEDVKKKRTKNVAFLHNRLKNINRLEYQIVEGAFAYPFLVKNNGAELRKELIKQKIYIPVLWPNVVKNTEPDSLAHQYALNILPLPCDQRYSEEDMEVICEMICSLI